MADSPSTCVALGGDLMVSRRLSVYAEPGYMAVRSLMSEADACVANLESVVGKYDEVVPAIRSGTYMITEPELVQDIQWLGVSMLACANSHSLNFGLDGLLRSNEYLDDARLLHCGTGENLRTASRPIYQDTAHGRVALVACSAHLTSDQSRATHQRVDSLGSPGVNPLRAEFIYTVDSATIDSLRRTAEGLGYHRSRENEAKSGFFTAAEIGLDDESQTQFMGRRYVAGDRFEVRSQCNAEDLTENLRQIREARRQADIVLATVHNQEHMELSHATGFSSGKDKEHPDFIREFAHRCIDEGADAVLITGPHYLLGVEIYQGRPIFHSLGNLVLQNETLRSVPSSAYQRSDVQDCLATPSDFFEARTLSDTRGMPAEPESWDAAIAVCDFNHGEGGTIRLRPVVLGFGNNRQNRGRPMLATDEDASRVLDRLVEHSALFGTEGERTAEGLTIRLGG